MTRIILLFIAILLCTGQALHAQQQDPPQVKVIQAQRPQLQQMKKQQQRMQQQRMQQQQQLPFDPMKEAFYPPELVMQHQRALEMSEEQRTYIINQAKEAQVRFTEIKWELEDAMQTLQASFNETRIDEPQALEYLERVLAL